MNATTAPTLPGLLSARRLLEMGCAETVVRRVLVVEVGLTAAEAATAIVAAQSQAASATATPASTASRSPSAPNTRVVPRGWHVHAFLVGANSRKVVIVNERLMPELIAPDLCCDLCVDADAGPDAHGSSPRVSRAVSTATRSASSRLRCTTTASTCTPIRSSATGSTPPLPTWCCRSSRGRPWSPTTTGMLGSKFAALSGERRAAERRLHWANDIAESAKFERAGWRVDPRACPRSRGDEPARPDAAVLDRGRPRQRRAAPHDRGPRRRRGRPRPRRRLTHRSAHTASTRSTCVRAMPRSRSADSATRRSSAM